MSAKKTQTKKPLDPVTEIFGLGVFGGCGFQAAIDTALKDDPVMMLSLQFQQNQHVTLGFDEPSLRDLSAKLDGLADLLLQRVKPGADKTPTAKQMATGTTYMSTMTA